jgi:hypothetical protein
VAAWADQSSASATSAAPSSARMWSGRAVICSTTMTTVSASMAVRLVMPKPNMISISAHPAPMHAVP